MSTSVLITQTGAGTWTAPANIDPTKHLVVVAVGSGGSGDSSDDLGYGGGGGCEVRCTLHVTPGQTFQYFVDVIDGTAGTWFGTQPEFGAECYAPSGQDGGDGGEGGGDEDGLDASTSGGNGEANQAGIGVDDYVIPGAPGGYGAGDGNPDSNGGGGGSAAAGPIDDFVPAQGYDQGGQGSSGPVPASSGLGGIGGNGYIAGVRAPTNGTNYGGGGGGGGVGTSGTQGVIRLTYSLLAASPARSSLSLSLSMGM